MPLTLEEQYNAALSRMTSGDLQGLSTLLTEPDSVTLDEQRTIAEKLGFKGGFLNAMINMVTDPTVWLAYYFSRRFPTSQYIRGAIPQRLIGGSNEFSGLSLVARPVVDFFRGTNIPKLTGLHMQRTSEVMQVGNKIFDEFLTRPNWSTEMPIVSLLLEGQNPAGATPELQALAMRVRGHMDELWGFLNKTQRVTGGFQGDRMTRATAEDFLPSEAPRYLRDYLPHIPLLGDESVVRMSGREALARFERGDIKQALLLTGENPADVWTPDMSDRLSSNFVRYQSFMNNVGTKIYSGRLFPRQRFGIPLQSEQGQQLFVTDLNVVLQRYIHSVARTYANNAPLTEMERNIASSVIEGADGKWTTIRPTAEPILVQIMNEGIGTAGGEYVTAPIMGTDKTVQYVRPSSVNQPVVHALRDLVRQVRGDMTEDEILFGNIFNSIRSKAVTSLRGIVNPREEKKLADGLSIMESSVRDRRMINGITSYFYATTLGLNPISAIKNLFQPMLTTASSIGIGPTMKGYSVLRERLPRYGDTFRRNLRDLQVNPAIPFFQRANLALEKAFHETFPELVHTGVRIDPRAFELSEAQVVEDMITGRTKFRSLDNFNRFLLQPFSQTEVANQVTSFFGAKEALKDAMRQGVIDLPVDPLHVDDWLNFNAAMTVSSTQFRPGPGSRSYLQSMIPAPFRMFTSFPMRLANFFVDSTVRGAMTEQQLKTADWIGRMTRGRNLGTLARTYLIGRTLTEGMREGLGVDLSDALGIMGPYTGLIESGKLMAPLTMAPLPSVFLGMANFIGSRDVRDLQPVELPGLGEIAFPKTLIPGGIAMTRVARALRQWRPDLGGFVDDDEQLMYKGDTTDLVVKMLGIPIEKERRLRSIIDQVEANRTRVREIRRAFATADRNFDVETMQKLDVQFREEFPEMGPLSLSNTDRKRYQQQSQITAVQRMLSTLGQRGRYLEQQVFEVDPDLIATEPAQVGWMP